MDAEVLIGLPRGATLWVPIQLVIVHIGPISHLAVRAAEEGAKQEGLSMLASKGPPGLLDRIATSSFSPHPA